MKMVKAEKEEEVLNSKHEIRNEEEEDEEAFSELASSASKSSVCFQSSFPFRI